MKTKPTKPCKAYFVVDPSGAIETWTCFPLQKMCISEFLRVCNVPSRADWKFSDWKRLGYRVERLPIGETT
jgi:hypothetical protein